MKIWVVAAALAAMALATMFGCASKRVSEFSDADIVALTASEVAPLLRDGRLSVERYVQLLLARARANEALNAFITLPEAEVLAAAREADQMRARGETLGPLFGLPISLKDNIVTAGMVSTFGTQVFAGHLAERDAPVVAQLRAAGAIIFGKNNAQEWAFGSNGYNSHYGQQLNPYDPSRIAGGSSGGSAAAVAARMVPLAIGSDTAASIRVPAAFTGLYGLRPTTGRYAGDGVAPIAATLDTVGPMARSVADLALVDGVLSGELEDLEVPALDGLRLGVPRGYFDQGVSAELRAAFESLLSRLRQAGVVLVEAPMPEAAITDQALYPILFGEAKTSIERFLSAWGGGVSFATLHQGLGADIKGMWDELVLPGAPGAIPEAVYQAALNDLRPQVIAGYKRYFEAHRVAAILFPATAHHAPLAKPDNPQTDIIDGQEVSIFLHDHNSSPGALAAQPGVVLPLAMSRQGLPLGVSIDGPANADRALLGIALAVDALIQPLPPAP